jgi:putative transposase
LIERRKLVDINGGKISIRKQCELLQVSRSGLYYKPSEISMEDKIIMRKIDEQFTKTPYYGVRRITAQLHRDGIKINHKKVRRLMRVMGLEVIYPKPRLSLGILRDEKYPYLLHGKKITYPDMVWSADITYIRLTSGFVYLVAIMDWYSRYVLSWRLSNTLGTSFCINALEEALTQSRAEIFNSDHGCQFTSKEFTGRLLDEGIKISMDGRGRYFDNIFTERLWRTVKYEEVYLHDYENMKEANERLNKYFNFYNSERLLQSLCYQTPLEIYRGCRKRAM